jgi:hypothetical protein
MFWTAVGRARRETFAAIRRGRGGSVVFLLLAFGFGYFLYAAKVEENAAPAGAADWFWLGLWSLVYAWLVNFFYNLWLAPYRIQRERVETAENSIKALRAENEQYRLAALPSIRFGEVKQERLVLSDHVTLYRTFIEVFNTSTSFGLEPCSVKVECLIDEDGVTEPHSALSLKEGGESFYLGPQEKCFALIATRQYQFGNAGRHVLQTKGQNYSLEMGKKCVLALVAMGKPSAPDRVTLSLSVDEANNLTAASLGTPREREAIEHKSG